MRRRLLWVGCFVASIALCLSSATEGDGTSASWANKNAREVLGSVMEGGHTEEYPGATWQLNARVFDLDSPEFQVIVTVEREPGSNAKIQRVDATVTQLRGENAIQQLTNLKEKNPDLTTESAAKQLKVETIRVKSEDCPELLKAVQRFEKMKVALTDASGGSRFIKQGARYDVWMEHLDDTLHLRYRDQKRYDPGRMYEVSRWLWDVREIVFSTCKSKGARTAR